MTGFKTKCPVDPQTRQWIESRMAWLKAQFGAGLYTRPVVLPAAEFFPDAYDGSEPTVRTLLDRVCGYMGIRCDEIEVSLYSEQVPIQEGGLVPGTGGLYVEEDGRFHIWLNESNLDDPGGLVATMAHELGHVLLLGHRRVSPEEPDHEPLTDLLTVFLGLGVITANAVVHEESWVNGGWSGWSIGRRGYISMPMYGYALAVFARERSEERPEWVKHLRPDVRYAFDQAICYLESADRDDVGDEGGGNRPAALVSTEVATDSENSPNEAPESARGADVPCCAFCGAELGEVAGADPVCKECQRSVEANERALQAAAQRDEADYRAKARVARLTCLMMTLAGVALILWQLIRAALK